MPISFSNIPDGFRIPLYYVEIDPSKAGLPINRMPALIVGIKIAAGNAPADVPTPIASQAQADRAFGQGSELSCMTRAFLANNFAQELWCLPVAEGTTAATGTITVATPPTDAGTLHLYIGGYHVPVGVAASDTVAIVAASIKSAIAAMPNLPVVGGTVTAGACPITCKWKGVTGNDIVLSDNYYGRVGGEIMPPGLTLTYTKMASGAGVPSFTNAISNLGEQEAEFVALGYTDSTSLTAWETEYGFSDTGRWGWMRQHFGHIFAARRGGSPSIPDAYADLLTNFAGSRNSAQLSVLALEQTVQSPVFEWAAAYCAKAARALSNDPARPLQTLNLNSMIPAPGQDRFLLTELNSLSKAGLATQRTLQDGVPKIARESTTATVNLYGMSDDAYELVTTLATLARVLRNQRQAITSKFPRHKLADDGTRFGPGQAIVTPKSIKAELLAQYRIDEFQGLVENATAFKNNLIVERDVNDPNRLNVLYPPDLVNQLRIFAVLAQFRLQYDRGVDIEIVGAGVPAPAVAGI